MKSNNKIEMHLLLIAIILSYFLMFIIETRKDMETIPVLMYHSVRENQSGIVTVTKEKFKEQMMILKEEGYKTLTLDEYYACLSGKMKKPAKCVLITFDDGYKDNYTQAYPILKELDFKAAIFTITKYNKPQTSFLDEQEILELSNNGIEIGSHTVNHTPLNRLSYAEQVEELKHSKAFLESILNKEVKYAAYPYGKYNKETLKAVEAAGYTMAFAAPDLEVKKLHGKYSIKRIYIGQSYSRNAFLRLIQAGQK